ncbi:tripeptidyl-peptidase 2 [Sarcoptes scabiei]|uniref:Tripeptidyl-peptidase 2 n=1 Tax=Sarcoptes scabiei TaxID=52283 RepID=A0A131ZW99_SARSC|nr:tripeptidyl-peptidase 2 [Sarcoptes scabiei]
MSCEKFEEFPFHALLPKRETQAFSFLTKHPEYDGRTIKIGILDSGVDPGAPGLSVTSDGKPKIIDVMDATGAGDVDTSTVVEIDSEGFITGLTKRKLRIPLDWKNPTGKYHIGVKNVYELFPESVRTRIKKDYVKKVFQPIHKPLLAEAMKKLEAFKLKHPDDEIIEDSNERLELMMERDELKAQVELLKTTQTKISDLGPTFDCIVFHDGEFWKACIDTTGEGRLDECTLLGNYRECFKFGTISENDKYNYAVNIHNDGNLLEIVGQCSAHGTHVASIAAANFPDDPDRNGVAPGAQLVSIIIGDSRLGTMETGSSIIRAYIKAIESGCDLINMSYGEHGHWAEGKVFDWAYELVHKHGVIYVCSAGNAGPALTTVGTPPTMPTESIIGVGAYVTPEMMIAEYSMREKLPGSAYSWSSRGPTMNGGLGVTVCGPGGAITSVPNWSLKHGVLMNGTSMASPNVCGCIALLLSGMKQKGLQYSPFSIRASLVNTALKVPDFEPFTHGNGLVQVEKAFEHLTTYSSESIERDIHFKITCDTNNQLGIYLRELEEVIKPSIHTVNVTPLLFRDDNQVRIDPSSLKDGTVNETWIQAYDVNCCEKGPVFKILITVIKPIVM